MAIVSQGSVHHQEGQKGYDCLISCDRLVTDANVLHFFLNIISSLIDSPVIFQ